LLLGVGVSGTGGSGVIILKYLSKPNYQIFQSSGTWTCPTGITEVEYLVVAGGGGGGVKSFKIVVAVVVRADFVRAQALRFSRDYLYVTVGAGGASVTSGHLAQVVEVTTPNFQR
jgi:hypothetical protein